MMLMADHHRLLELCWSWRRGSSDWGNFKVAYLNIQVKFVVLELGGQGELGEHLLFVLGSRDRQDSAVEGGGGAHLVELDGAGGSWKVDKKSRLTKVDKESRLTKVDKEASFLFFPRSQSSYQGGGCFNQILSCQI